MLVNARLCQRKVTDVVDGSTDAQVDASCDPREVLEQMHWKKWLLERRVAFPQCENDERAASYDHECDDPRTGPWVN
jgi:hypothetical protein